MRLSKVSFTVILPWHFSREKTFENVYSATKSGSAGILAGKRLMGMSTRLLRTSTVDVRMSAAPPRAPAPAQQHYADSPRSGTYSQTSNRPLTFENM